MLIKDFIYTDDKGYCTGINWDMVNSVPEFVKLKECEQNPKWHREGNAFIHTEEVVKHMLEIISMRELLNNVEYIYNPDLTARQSVILATAALFHDIGKGVTTEFKKGAWHAYGHEVESEKITRSLLWDEDIEMREAVCSLVALHMEPLNITRSNFRKMISKLDKRIHETDYRGIEINDLFLLKLADTLGSDMENEDRKSLDIAFLHRMYYNLSHDRIMDDDFMDGLLSDYDRHKAPYKDKLLRYGIIMIGVPGAGKNFFVENMLKKGNGYTLYTHPSARTMTVISRDDIREEIGMCKPGEKCLGTPEQEDEVTRIYYEKVEDAVKISDVIVFNDMNIKYKYRQKYHEALEKHNEYEWVWIYIYVEAPTLSTNINRREGQILEKYFQGFTRTLDWPKPDEYDTLIISKQYS